MPATLVQHQEFHHHQPFLNARFHVTRNDHQEVMALIAKDAGALVRRAQVQLTQVQEPARVRVFHLIQYAL